MKAIWNGKVIADSDKIINLEGNKYFPMKSVNMEYLTNSETHTVCHWKGTASYYNIVVNGEINKDAAWYYPEPLAMANKISGYLAFWNGVEIVD